MQRATPATVSRILAIGWLRRHTNWVALQSRSKVLVIAAVLVYGLGIVATYASNLMPLIKDRFLLEIWIALLLVVAYALYQLKLPGFLRQYPDLSTYRMKSGNGTEPLKAALQTLANDIQQRNKSVSISNEDFRHSITAIENRCADASGGKLISTDIAAGNFATMTIRNEKADDAYLMTRDLIADAYSEVARFVIAACVLVPTIYFAWQGCVRFLRLIVTLTSGDNNG